MGCGEILSIIVPSVLAIIAIVAPRIIDAWDNARKSSTQIREERLQYNTFEYNLKKSKIKKGYSIKDILEKVFRLPNVSEDYRIEIKNGNIQVLKKNLGDDYSPIPNNCIDLDTNIYAIFTRKPKREK